MHGNGVAMFSFCAISNDDVGELQTACGCCQSTFINRCNLWMWISGDAKQFDIEHQGCVRWNNSREALIAIGEISWDDELALATNLHSGNTFVPALNHHPDTECELKRATANGAVEFRSICQDTGVVDGDILALCGGWTLSYGDVFVLKTTVSCNH